MSMFNERLDVKLINLIQTNSVLYDHNHPKYMDFNAREVAWQRIGDEMKRPAGDCKIRWINIRDVYRRILKKNMTTPNNKSKPYKYESELSFMKPFYKDVILPGDNDEDKNQWSDDDFPADVHGSDEDKTPKKPKKAPKKRRKKSTDDEDKGPPMAFNEASNSSDFDSTDPVDAFLLSIGATLKTFSPYHLNLAKSKIFAVVQEHDLQQIVQKTNDVKASVSDSMFME